jgi:hypothetical protein
MPLHLYDTLRRAQVPFEPRDEGKASIYVCGPTVQAVRARRARARHGRLRRAAALPRLVRATTCCSSERHRRRRQDHPAGDARGLHAGPHRSPLHPRVQRRDAGARGAAARRRSRSRPGTSSRCRTSSRSSSTGQGLRPRRQRLVPGPEFPGYGKLSGRRIDDLVGGEDVVGADVKDDPLDFAMWKAAKPTSRRGRPRGATAAPAGTSSARRWRPSTSGTGSTSTAAGSTSSSRTTRTRSPSTRPPTASRSRATGSTTAWSAWARRRCPSPRQHRLAARGDREWGGGRCGSGTCRPTTARR